MSTTLARKFRVDVTSDLTLATGWVQLKGINSLDYEVTPDLEDSSDYDTNGFATVEVTQYAWTLEPTVNRHATSGVYDPGQELVRARIGQFSTAARCGVRWYDNLYAGPEAYSGVAIPTWKPTNTAVKDLEQADITFTGTDIALNIGISNPAAGLGAPVLLTALPTGIGTGGMVTITGTGFTGTVPTTGVKFGATNATSWVVISDNTIVAILPSGSAGATTITVTNAVGASNALAYTRAA